MALKFKVRADFAAPNNKDLIWQASEISARDPQVRSAAMSKAEQVQATARSILLAAPVDSTAMRRNAEMTASLVNVESVMVFPRRAVLPGSPIPVALASSLSKDTQAWENGDRGRPATFFFTRAWKSVAG